MVASKVQNKAFNNPRNLFFLQRELAIVSMNSIAYIRVKCYNLGNYDGASSSS